MRQLIIIGLLLLTGCFPTIERRQYCGRVVEKFHTAAGYKVQANAYVVFYSDSLKRNVAVDVTWNSYANAKVGENICFSLMDRDLHQ